MSSCRRRRASSTRGTTLLWVRWAHSIPTRRQRARRSRSFLQVNKERLGIEFDAIIGSSCTVLNSKNVVVARPEESEGLLRKMMHSNSDDKYAAFINAYSKRAISINVPKGETREIKLLFLNHDQPLLSHVFMNADQGAKAKIVEVYASTATKPSAMATIHEITSGNDSNFELDAIHNENSLTTLLSFCRNSHRDQRKPQVQHLLQRHEPEQGAERHERQLEDKPHRGKRGRLRLWSSRSSTSRRRYSTRGGRATQAWSRRPC